MQLSPRFTGAAGSPLTATILLSFVATIIPQPVPQKRQAALSQRHFSGSWALSVLGTAIPATLAALAMAVFLMKSRLFIVSSLV